MTLSNAAVDAFTSQLLSLAPDVDYVRVRQAQVEQASTFGQNFEDEEGEPSVDDFETAVVKLAGYHEVLSEPESTGRSEVNI